MQQSLEGVTVLELGAGYGHFINNVVCRRRIAVDAWEGLTGFQPEGVENRVGDTTNLNFIEDANLDVVLATNLFEHRPQAWLASVLNALTRKARSGGTLNILRLNYCVCSEEYFDDFTHVSVNSVRGLCDFLGAQDFKVLNCEPGSCLRR